MFLFVYNPKSYTSIILFSLRSKPVLIVWNKRLCITNEFYLVASFKNSTYTWSYYYST